MALSLRLLLTASTCTVAANPLSIGDTPALSFHLTASLFAAIAVPDSKPPPPTGTTIASTSAGNSETRVTCCGFIGLGTVQNPARRRWIIHGA